MAKKILAKERHRMKEIPQLCKILWQRTKWTGWRKNKSRKDMRRNQVSANLLSSEKKVVFQLHWIRNHEGDRGQNIAQLHGKGEHFARDILYTLKFWEEGLP